MLYCIHSLSGDQVCHPSVQREASSVIEGDDKVKVCLNSKLQKESSWSRKCSITQYSDTKLQTVQIKIFAPTDSLTSHLVKKAINAYVAA